MNERGKVNAGTGQSFRGFLRREDGALLPFAMFLLVMMIMIGGLAIDVMRHEERRVLLQQTLDRSVLAAAGLKQTLDPQSVVNDYFEKMGLSEYLQGVTVDQGLNFRSVEADAKGDTNPFFMRMMGIDKFNVAAASGAEQRINNIEISLVLDVSGSMAGSKLTNLKSAANQFIDTVLDQDVENRVSIAIVPYNGQVNLPQYMQDLYTKLDDHGVANVNCFDLPASAYTGLGLSRTAGMPVTAHADTYSTTTSSYVAPTDSNNAVPVATNRWCPESSANVILAPTNNRATLKGHINNLTAVGATSINAGMKWGTMLLDPSSRSVISAMVAQGKTPTNFAGRPFDYFDRETMKIVVLMTDGEHFAEERVNSGYRAGNSPIYLYNGVYSVYHASKSGSSKYYYPSTNKWNSGPSGGSSAKQQTWPQVWAALRMSYVARQFYARPGITGYDAQMDIFRTKTEIPAMDNQLQTVCNMAREKNIIVFGIAFEAPPNGQAEIKECATSDSHYFSASGLQIATVFQVIANQISFLRLTQ